MNRTVFANDVVTANLDFRFSFRRKRDVLRQRANDRAVANEISGADCDFAFDHDV